MQILALLLLALLVLPSCATRGVNKQVVNRQGLEVFLRSEKPTFGFSTIEQGYSQPVEISAARLEAILGGIQIDMRPSEKSAVRERRYAIPKRSLPKIAEGLSEGLALAGPNQQVVVMSLRKQMQKAFFNRKYLTSLIAFVEGDELVIHISRVDWKTDEHKKGDKIRNDRSQLPKPIVGEYVMPFDTIASDHYQTAGRQGVKVDWQSQAFGADTIQDNIAGGRTGADEAGEAATSQTGERQPSETAAGAGAESPDVAAASGTAAAGAAAGAGAEPPAPDAAATQAATREISDLTADELRQLADLEDARDAGRIDATEYERRRLEILSTRP